MDVQLSSPTARFMYQEAGVDLAAAREAAPGEPIIRTLEAEVGFFFQELGSLEAELARIDGDGRLSLEGKRERRQEIVNVWSELAELRAERATAEAARLVESLESQVRLEPLAGEPVLEQSLLANARSDAQMLLGGESDPLRVMEKMRQIVEESGDPTLVYLILGTPWPQHFLASKGMAAEDARVWEHYRRELLPPHLTGEALKAHQRLQRLRPAARLGEMLATTRAYLLQEL
jgi:hypothetical protein